VGAERFQRCASQKQDDSAAQLENGPNPVNGAEFVLRLQRLRPDDGLSVNRSTGS